MQTRTRVEYQRAAWRKEWQTFDVTLVRNGVRQHTETGISEHDLQKIIRLFEAVGIEAEEFVAGSVCRPRFPRG